MKNIGLDRIRKMLETAHTEANVFPHTDIYKEGWMLRILLSIQSDGTECFPFSFYPGARWFSEAKIGSPFLPRFQGDKLADGYTTVDGVVGHFEFQPGTKIGLKLTSNSRQFVVTEAKIFSPLSKKTTNASYYDQATRNVACMAWVVSESEKSVDEIESLGFYVVAPDSQIKRGVFSALVNKSNIRNKVKRRVDSYSKEDKKYLELQTWHEEFFNPIIKRIEMNCVAWESIIEKVDDPSIWDFYNRCLEFNESAKNNP